MPKSQQNSKTLKFWNVRTLWLNVLISTICLRLSSVKRVCIYQMQSAPILWVVGIYSGSKLPSIERPPGGMHLSKTGPARERQSLPSRSSASGELSSLPHRCFMHHQKLQETSLHPRILPSLEIVGFPQDLGAWLHFQMTDLFGVPDVYLWIPKQKSTALITWANEQRGPDHLWYSVSGIQPQIISHTKEGVGYKQDKPTEFHSLWTLRKYNS